MDIARSIQAVIERRRALLPRLEADTRRWARLAEHLSELQGDLDALIGSLPEGEAREGIAAAMDGLRRQQLLTEIGRLRGDLAVLHTRFSRETIHVGVSGQARVGKSTLLQTISGLTDDQIPTGEGIPVTAVRSQIFHSRSRQRALLTLHDFRSFRDVVLQPYFDALRLPAPPSTPEAFAAWRCPKESELDAGILQAETAKATRNRLEQIHATFWSYRDFLTGGRKDVPLPELRPWVAYPTIAEVEANQTGRQYLAVQNVVIECGFPRAAVENLGLIDLPGMGEIDPRAEQHHLAGLRDEVDLVLLIKRPTDTAAYWSSKDSATLDVLSRARGAIRNLEDFVMIGINEGGASEGLRRSLTHSINTQLHHDESETRYQLLRFDARSQDSCDGDLLTPALHHLAERLPTMDQQLLAAVIDGGSHIVAGVRAAVADLRKQMELAAVHAAGAEDALWARTQQLRDDLASDLAGLEAQLWRRVDGGEEDADFIAAVEHIRGEIKDWAQEGFGQGVEDWQERALKRMLRDGGSAGLATDSLNAVRVEIGNFFAGLDTCLDEKVTWLWDRIADILAEHFPGLAAGESGQARLKAMAQRIDEMVEPCPAYAEAIASLLELSLNYRSHLHPRVNQELRGLRYERSDDDGAVHTEFAVQASPAGAAEVYQQVTQLVEQAAFEAQQALFRTEARLPTLAQHAAVEQFADRVSRSQDAERELLRLARAYRDEIWPGAFADINNRSTWFTRTRERLRVTLEVLEAVEIGRRSLEDAR